MNHVVTAHYWTLYSKVWQPPPTDIIRIRERRSCSYPELHRGIYVTRMPQVLPLGLERAYIRILERNRKHCFQISSGQFENLA